MSPFAILGIAVAGLAAFALYRAFRGKRSGGGPSYFGPGLDYGGSMRDDDEPRDAFEGGGGTFGGGGASGSWDDGVDSDSDSGDGGDGGDE